jgi:Right handed beta helix region
MLRPVLLMAVSIIFAMTGGKASTQCVAFPKEGIVGAVLDQPGSYCMKRDLVVEGTYNWLAWEGRRYHSASRYALVLGASDVVVDLGGKSVRSNAASLFAGVLGSVVSKPLVQSGSNWSDRVNSIDWSKANRNVTIKNGSIDLEFASYKADNNPLGILLATDREWYAFPEIASEQELLFRGDFGYLPRDRNNYPNRKITLENLTIRTPGYGIAVFGAGTVIRNCTIVTESGVGIWSFGGGAVIENNTITVRRNKRLGKTFLPTDAAIVLQDGDNSIVRNNVMHLEPDGVGINLVNSSVVTMADNVNEGWFGFQRKAVSVKHTSLAPALLPSPAPTPATVRISSDPPCGGTDYFGKPLSPDAICDRSKSGR